MFFIGPSDLSQSLGFPGNPKAPPVAKAIDETLKKIVAAGHTPGMPASTDAVQDVLGKGVRYIYTHIPKLLKTSADNYFDAARGSGRWNNYRHKADQAAPPANTSLPGAMTPV